MIGRATRYFFVLFATGSFGLKSQQCWQNRRSLSRHSRVTTKRRMVDNSSSSSSILPSETQRQKWIVSTLTGDKPTPTPTGSSTIKTRLFLHFDINETILLGDDAGGDSCHESVQKMLAKSAFCRLPKSVGAGAESSWEDTQQAEPTHWWDGQEMGQETSVPPLYTGWTWPDGCCPYYRTAYKKRSKAFVDQYDGQIYRTVLDACDAALLASSSLHHNHILPAFYETLHHMIHHEEERSFRVVFRTFGSDIDEIAKLVTDFAQGRHPDFPTVNYPALELPKAQLFQGRWKELDNGRVIYQLWDQEESKVVASGDAEILELLTQHTICGIRDDYLYWKEHQWDPTAGKPVWIPQYQKGMQLYDHHLLFDDNIHNLPHDGIACVRRQNSVENTFVTLDGATMHDQSQGVHLIRVPTIEPVLNPKWYIEQIDEARHQLQQQLVERV